jgi:ubiquinone/menaquinone biosynthesis C-methylase UbiE
MNNAKERFSNRVEDYRKYRPGYPAELASFITEKCNPRKDWTIADIGSGTGISSIFLQTHSGCTVFAIEPNREMRMEAEKAFADCSQIISVDGSSEDTTLPDESVNMVSAFQSFHWFDKERAKKETKRIVKSPGWMLWVWNERQVKGTRFLEQYEHLLQKLPEYRRVDHRNTTTGHLSAFIDHKELAFMEFPNVQRFDFEGLKGRFFSSSYTAPGGTLAYDEQKKALADVFDRTNENGFVGFRYLTKAWLGRVK